jgi:predicted O-linked N-acetylglucosamine transferase (SPINDLY family)
VPALTPQQAFDLASQHHRAGRCAEATDLCRQLLALYPRNPAVLHLRGLIALRAGLPVEAEDWFRQAIAIHPADAAFHNDLGEALKAQDRLDEAIAAYRRALEIQPNSAPIHNNLGNAFKAQDRREEAVAAYRVGIQLDPSLAEIHSNLGTVLRVQGKLDEAISALRRAIALKPDYAMACNNLGHALLDNRQPAEAIAAFQQALALQPVFALAQNNLGTALKALGNVDESIAAYRRALEMDPHHLLALNNLANELHERGELADALPFYERALALPQATASAHSNYLAVLQYQPRMTLQKLAEAHAAFDQRHALPFRSTWQPHANSRDPDRPLRLGFVSPYFGVHPVGFFLVRPLEHLDRRGFEVVCYEDKVKHDEMNSRFRARAAEWHDVRYLSDEQLASRIREDRIDILFDLTGHNARNRLLVFARKPAPIQITWLDYVGTTGLSAMDYIIADARQIPPEAERYYREKVLRMPDDYICFDATTEPPVGRLPAAANGFVTFASFNSVPKTSAQIIEVWSRILHEVPNSRLRFKNRGFDDPSTVARIQRQFSAQGIDTGRMTFEGWAVRGNLLATYGEVDIVLDTFPYNGGLNTCEALWMGVPVVTCPGETFASRHGLAHLSRSRYRPAAAHRDARRAACEGGRLAAVRRSAIRRKPRDVAAKSMAAMVRRTK